MSMRCEKFPFFQSYYTSAKLLESEDKQLRFLISILDYAFLGKEPELESELRAMFELAKPNLDKSISFAEKASERGKLGGAPKGNKNASKDKGSKTTYSLSENKLNKDKNKDMEKEKDKEYEKGYSDSPTGESTRTRKADIDFGSFSK